MSGGILGEDWRREMFGRARSDLVYCLSFPGFVTERPSDDFCCVLGI